MQPLSTQKIDNRLTELIERYPGVANRHVQLIQKYLRDNHKHVYGKTAIWRLVNNRVPLSPKNIIVKTAIEEINAEFEKELLTA